MTSAIELERIWKTYRRGAEEVHALDGLSLAIQPGEFVAIVGPSGSGKSTSLHLMGCMDRPTEGSIRIQGEAVEGAEEDQLVRLRQRRIGFVFQQFFLMPTLTALENVELPTLFSGGGGDGRELLALVGLSGRENHLPKELSGGEMQRVAIARALVNGPQILLADEPTGNLDSANAEGIFGLFRHLSQEQGLTVVVITHNEELAARADRVIHLKDGRVAG